ncbi:hypothetical protein ACIPXV_18480 [Streptomyces libani]|uniref:hypothetical protein n=1 Tax=Streptomyces nigrescens TaxID=1920 RepID=UPI0038168F94
MMSGRRQGGKGIGLAGSAAGLRGSGPDPTDAFVDAYRIPAESVTVWIQEVPTRQLGL